MEGSIFWWWQFLLSYGILNDMLSLYMGDKMKVSIITVGCKLNQFESDALAQLLRANGIEVVDEIETSDVVVINTCTVTNTADSKSRQHMKQAKRQGKKVVVTGCYASTDGEEILQRGLADMILPNEAKFSLASVLLETPIEEKGDFPVVIEYERTRAFLKIQDGCDRFCSYCKIPYGRGKSRSLHALEVKRRFHQLVERGYREIVLTGVNISDYRDGDISLGILLRDLIELSGEFRVRLSSLQPDQVDDPLLSLLSHPKLAPHFHLSLQSGSDAVLARMRRHYTRSAFLDLCDHIRAHRFDTALTTDIIVGFPQESDEEFGQTKDLVQRVKFSRVHLFSYSPRAGTWAAQQPQLADDVKKARLHELEALASQTAEEWTKEVILGKTATVLVEETNGNVSYGYTEQYLYTRLEGKFSVNTFVSCVPYATWLHQGAIAVAARPTSKHFS